MIGWKRALMLCYSARITGICSDPPCDRLRLGFATATTTKSLLSPVSKFDGASSRLHVCTAIQLPNVHNHTTVPLDLSFYAHKALELVWTSNSLSLATDEKMEKMIFTSQ